MKNFAIRDLENFSGIKAHTLRIWEQRYGFIKPKRNDVNFRYYTIDELSRLLNISLLTKNGYRISKVSSMDHSEVDLKIKELDADHDRQLKALNDLIVNMYRLNPEAFEETLDQSFQSWRSDVVLKEIILPFLKKTGLLWEGHQLTEEHFVVTIIRKKIILAIDRLQPPDHSQKTVLLYLKDGKQLDLVLYFTHFLLKYQGVQVLFMGTDVSINNLKAVVKMRQPQIVFTYPEEKNKNNYKELSLWLTSDAPLTKMVIAHPNHNQMEKSLNNIFILPLDKALSLLLPITHQSA